MKIEKVVFSSSEQYSDFWNIQSKVFKEGLGIEPVCLLFGKKENTDVTEKYGKVHEMEFIDNLPKILQIIWSKFYFTKHEPETVWMTGDIDLIPLNRDYFIKNIEHCEDDSFLHLNWDACNPGGSAGWMRGPMLLMQNGTNLPAHYHVAKGRVFEEVYGCSVTFEEQIQDIMSSIIASRTYGHMRAENRLDVRDKEEYWWTAEEIYSSARLWSKVMKNEVKFHGFSYNNVNNTQCISRHIFDHQKNDYIYDKQKLRNKEYVDLHCARGFGTQATDQNWWDEKTGFAPAPTGFKLYEEQTMRIIRESGILDKQ